MTISYPRIVKTDPIQYTGNFPISGSFYIYFSQDLDTSTINNYTVYLRKDVESTNVPIDISYDRTTYTICVTPKSFLEYDKVYKLTIVGTIDPTNPNIIGIKSTQGYPLYGTYVLSIKTASSNISYTEEQKPEEIKQTDVVTVISTDYLSVIKTIPSDGESNVDLKDLYNSSIFVYFNDSVNISNLLSYDAIFGSGIFGHSVVGRLSEINNDYITIVRKHVLDNKEYVVVPIDVKYYNYLNAFVIELSSDDIQPNYEYNVTIKKGISGTTLLPMLSDYSFWFTTLYVPYYIDARSILIELGDVVTNVPLDTVNRLIYENTMIMYNKGMIVIDSKGNLIEPYLTYLICKVKYDLLRAIMTGVVLSGGSKRLGDFQIDINVNADLLGRLLDDFYNCYVGSIRDAKRSDYVRTPIPSKLDSRAPWHLYPYRGYRHNLWGKKQPYSSFMIDEEGEDL